MWIVTGATGHIGNVLVRTSPVGLPGAQCCNPATIPPLRPAGIYSRDVLDRLHLARFEGATGVFHSPD
jgi:hypothetical protein